MVSYAPPQHGDKEPTENLQPATELWFKNSSRIILCHWTVWLSENNRLKILINHRNFTQREVLKNIVRINIHKNVPTVHTHTTTSR